MKALWITLGALAATAGIVYLMKDNEKVKNALDKINETTSNTLGKINSNWKKTTDQFNQKLATQTS